MKENTENIPENKITLEQATSADIKKCLEIEKGNGSKTYVFLADAAEVEEEMAKGPFYLIKKDSEIVGLVSYYMEKEDRAYISGLSVDLKYKGQGIGRKALEQVLSELENVPVVWLVTHPENAGAVHLYESLGFKITGRKENYFGDGEPRIELTLTKEVTS